MKTIKTILLILFLFMIYTESYSADTGAEDLDITYSREYLISSRDDFIEMHGDLPIK